MIARLVSGTTRRMSGPDSPTPTLLQLGQRYRERGELDEAEAVLEQVIRYDPDRPEGYIAWATIRVERDDVKGAFTLFELLTERLPDFPPGWVFRAQAEEALERKADALEDSRLRHTSDAQSAAWRGVQLSLVLGLNLLAWKTLAAVD